MKRLKKVLLITTIVLFMFTILFLFHLVNRNYPNNIVNKMINGFFIVFTPALTALFITYLMEPLMHYFRKKLKLSKVLSVFITTFIVLVVLIGFSAFIVLFAFEQTKNMIDFVITSDLIANLRTLFAKNGLENIYDFVYDYVVNFDYTQLLNGVSSKLFTVLGQTLTTAILTPIFLWYFLSARKEIFTSAGNLVADAYKKDVFEIAKRSNEVIIAYFKSKVLSMIFLFIAFMILFTVMGFPIGYVVFFAMMITIFDLIPYIGPFVANAIPVIYVFANGGTHILYSSIHVSGLIAAIILIGVNVIFQFVQGNIIMPKLAGKEMEIHPLIILSSMLFFGNILGIWGIILSIPLGGIIIVIFKFYKEKASTLKMMETPEMKEEHPISQ